MGAVSNLCIREWQRAGIKPVQGPQAENLARMSHLAADLIRVIELERAGIRDGDGYWSGCDPIHEIINELVENERMNDTYRQDCESPR